MSVDRDLVEYYSRRAREYERIYEKPERQRDLGWLREELPRRLAGSRVLELACGTGYWTTVIATAAIHVTAVDASREVLEIARRKPRTAGRVHFVEADACALPPRLGDFDAGFAGFYWSHVPRARLPVWLAGFAASLRPGARLVILDNRYVAGSSTPISCCDAEGDTWQERRLADGSVHRVLKNFPEPVEIDAALGSIGNHPEVRLLDYYWLASVTVSSAGRS